MYTINNISDYFEISEGKLKPLPDSKVIDEEIEYFEVPEGVRVVSNDCFAHLPRLAKIDLSNDVETVGKNVFGLYVNEVKLGKKVKDISADAFRTAPVIKSVSVHKKNPYFQSFMGMLLNREGNELLFAPKYSVGRFLLEHIDGVNRSTETLKNKINGKIDNILLKKTEKFFRNNVSQIAPYSMAVFPELLGDNFKEFLTKTEYDLHWVKGLEKVGRAAFKTNYFYRNISFEEGLKTIEELAFASCKKMELINLPESVERIGSYAFFGCSALDSLIIPDNIQKIESGLCRECTALKEVNIPKQCTVIEKEAFENCKSLTRLHIPGTVNTIESKAFSGCENLEIAVSKSTVCAEDAFDGCMKVIYE